jgi:hypothetical protein
LFVACAIELTTLFIACSAGENIDINPKTRELEARSNSRMGIAQYGAHILGDEFSVITEKIPDVTYRAEQAHVDETPK